MILSESIEKKKKQQQQQIQLKLSTIFKRKVIDTPQTFGSFYDANGEKYCAISALSKYLGYDIEAAVSKKVQNGNNTNPAELIPHGILEKIENFRISPYVIIIKKAPSVFAQDQIIIIVIA